MLPVVFVMFDLLNTPMATSTTRGRLRQVLVSKRVHLSTMIALVLITVGMNRDGTYEHADTIILSPGQRLLKVLFMVAFFPRAAVWPAGLRPHYKVFPSDLQLSPGEDLALSYPASDTCLSAAVVFGMFVVALTHAVDVYVSQRTRAALVRPLSVSFFLFCPSLFLFPGHITHSRRGDEIDEAECVFRLNSAPTIGYELDAGRKTTVRVVSQEG